MEASYPALFLNSLGKRLSTQGIANILDQLRQQAGIERHIMPHMLRHTVVTLLLRNGVDIRVVQEFLATRPKRLHNATHTLLKNTWLEF